MSSPKSVEDSNLFRAQELLSSLAKFATTGGLNKEFTRQQKLFLELSQPDEVEQENMLDWFLFDWFDDSGVCAVTHFLQQHKNLSQTDREILEGWVDSVNSVFEIASVSQLSMFLKEIESGDTFNVKLPASTNFQRGEYLATRLLPLHDHFILAGQQFVIPDRQHALEVFEMRRDVEALSSPEALEKAQQKYCAAFLECFGCTEMTVPSNQLTSVLTRFQRYVLYEQRDPENNLTAAELFQDAFDRDVTLPDIPSFPDQLLDAGEVTIISDEFDGLVLLPDYSHFKRIFEADDPDSASGEWRELVWHYIKDPNIPIVAFERIAERHSERLEKVLRQLLGDDSFSIEHLYALLLHYKEPAEGFDNLADDAKLWDLLNGNNRETTGTARKGSAKAGSPSGPGEKTARKNTTTASAGTAAHRRTKKR